MTRVLRRAAAVAAGSAATIAAARVLTAPRRGVWAPPAGTVDRGTLAVRRLGRAGPPIVLLHGMCGSNRFWGRAMDALAEDARLIVPDLLGFGESPQPDSGYGPAEHAGAVAAALLEAGVEEPALVVGHSMGALVAIALEHLHPDVVDSVVAFAPPLFTDREVAERHVRRMGPVERLMAFDPPAQAVCRVMCRHRRAAAWVAVIARPDLPPALARDAVRHTWESYSLSLEGLILSGVGVEWLEAATHPVRIAVAADDPVADVPLLRRVHEANAAVDVVVWPDGGTTCRSRAHLRASA